MELVDTVIIGGGQAGLTISHSLSKRGLVLSADPDARSMNSAQDPAIIDSLNLRDAGITSIVWATGYGYDSDWVKLNVFDDYGVPATVEECDALGKSCATGSCVVLMNQALLTRAKRSTVR